MKILKLIFDFLYEFVQMLIKACLISAILATCYFSYHIFINTALFDEKTAVISQAVSNYHKYITGMVNEKFPEPNIERMSKANILLLNMTQYYLGSGVIIKINDEAYILSVAHLTKEKDDRYIMEEGGNLYTLDLVKSDKKKDLALFKFKTEPVGLEYANISNTIPNIGDKIICIGNPAGLDDAVTTGVIMQETKKHYYITAPIYMGSSGGGLYNQKEELIGINSSINVDILSHNNGVLHHTFTVGRSINLIIIKDFLKGV